MSYFSYFSSSSQTGYWNFIKYLFTAWNSLRNFEIVLKKKVKVFIFFSKVPFDGGHGRRGQKHLRVIRPRRTRLIGSMFFETVWVETTKKRDSVLGILRNIVTKLRTFVRNLYVTCVYLYITFHSLSKQILENRVVWNRVIWGKVAVFLRNSCSLSTVFFGSRLYFSQAAKGISFPYARVRWWSGRFTTMIIELKASLQKRAHVRANQRRGWVRLILIFGGNTERYTSNSDLQANYYSGV